MCSEQQKELVGVACSSSCYASPTLEIVATLIKTTKFNIIHSVTAGRIATLSSTLPDNSLIPDHQLYFL